MIRQIDARLAVALVAAATVAACSGNTDPSGGSTAQLAIVNALPIINAAQLRLDQAGVALPASGQTSHLTVSAGNHQLQLTSSTGHPFATLSFSIDPDSTRTVVVTGGADSGTVTFPIDTATAPPPPSGASTLLINSAPGLGPLDIVMYQAGSDSVYRFGNFTAQAQPIYAGWVPGTYTITATEHGATAALATVEITLAPGDIWNVILTTSIEGGPALQANKQ